MADTRITMRDIASHFGISVNTVHKAIAGKPGVGAKTRAEILKYAEEVGYERNESASMLRRKAPVVYVVLPSPEDDGRFFYAKLWSGFEAFAASHSSGDIEFRRIAFRPGCYRKELAKIREKMDAGERVNGLLAFAPENDADLLELERVAEHGMPIELVMGQDRRVPHIGAAMPDYRVAGLLMAEQAANLMRGRGDGTTAPSVVLLSGDPTVEAHRFVADAFRGELERELPEAQIVDVPGGHGERDELPGRVRGAMEGHAPSFACSVFATGSMVLAGVLEETGLAGTVPAIGSDIFPENIEALRNHTFSNLLFKDPEGLAFRAAGTLSAYLMYATAEEGLIVGDVELVFRSNLEHYLKR
ncbi:MAG: LacI family DNA-binding transcriptional regulator [Atopobiaceae bacterium]